MGTKLNPGKFDCYEDAAPDEPMFVLLARDPVAPLLVEMWVKLRQMVKPNNAVKRREAQECANAMRKWRKRNT